ncbi:DUF488 domain-containing protein [Luteibacter sp. SG786]|uniref:DUF488 domain-containing protein n=1 Tax=Luteibacter sp. SG786 TaxID=2587130 RepID=UPI0014214F4D|nr:DUF488 domain-containing protein [Luteibacter sp. SG786]NII54990.1 uncharacterized protein (DUF488 family) [Luteibacter sp. SG786]
MRSDLSLYSVGHSNREIDAFLAVLGDARIECVVDVRTFPRSRTNPQFNVEVLPDALAEHGIAYEYLPDLGGRRRKSRDIPPEVNGFWKVSSFHNYADYAMSDAFQASLAELLRLGEERRCAMMCSEVLWWRCHRRIIADYAMAAGRKVWHLFDVGHVEEARLTPGAVIERGLVAYPASP